MSQSQKAIVLSRIQRYQALDNQYGLRNVKP